MTMKKTRRYKKPKGPTRIGRVEKAFRLMAAGMDLEPQGLLAKLIEEGVTQSEIAEQLNCTRQAVGILADRYNCEFPGARIDENDVSKSAAGMSFQRYIRIYGKTKSQAEMARELNISLSTLRRRLHKRGIEKPRKRKGSNNQ